MSNIDRRIIFLLVALALALPLVLKFRVPPAPMKSAAQLFSVVDDLEPKEGEFAFLALDFGPGTQAENQPQAEVIVEHLMRKRIPILFFTAYALAESFLNSVPESVAARLQKESPGEKWEYGKDWVSLGYRPGGALIVQSIAKAQNLLELFDKDARGNYMRDLPAMKNVTTFKSMKLLAEFTGLLGMFDMYIQFLQSKDHRPLFGHGCTSITIPEGFVYLDSGQLNGLLEGIAGAAWYSELLKKKYPERRPDNAGAINTGLGVAHLVIIALILAGNIFGRNEL